MDSSTACHELREPGVIDEAMIYNAIIEQGPKNEEGRLFKEQGVDYKEVTNLRLEFLDILKIDHLWMMTGLTKLQLCNNIIEEIENLEMLTQLRELDLSFNNIGQIKNLDSLRKLEVLTLFQNKIERLENLENLTLLAVLSVGNNRISDFDNVIYLRRFDSLKSLNMAGNPICQEENFTKHVVAYLPQLVYYEYRMIRGEEKMEAREMYLRDLIKLEQDEAGEKEIEMAKRKAEEQEEVNAKAFVDGLSGDKLFLSMFENDADGKTLLLMGESVMDIYHEFRKGFSQITQDILTLGLEQASLRQAEMEEFDKVVAKSTEKAYSESRLIMENFLSEKERIFQDIKEILVSEEEDEEALTGLSLEIQAANELFQDLCQRTWNTLMKKELHFYEAKEEVNGTYERSLTDLVNQFIENAQTLFTQLRQFQGGFNESISDAANKFFTNYTVSSLGGAASKEFEKLPAELVHMMQDREVLMNALAASHDLHMLVIDQREDRLISSVRSWLANLVDNMVRAEIQRNRDAVTEINHFLDTQKAELDKITSTPLGILLLSKEVQYVLNIT